MKNSQGNREISTSMYGTTQSYGQGQSEQYQTTAFNPTSDFQLVNTEWQAKEHQTFGFAQKQYTSGDGLRNDEAANMSRFSSQFAIEKPAMEQGSSSHFTCASYSPRNSNNYDYNSNISEQTAIPNHPIHSNKNQPHEHLSSPQDNQTFQFDRSFETCYVQKPFNVVNSFPDLPRRWSHHNSAQQFASRDFTEGKSPTQPYNYPGASLGVGTDVGASDGINFRDTPAFFPTSPGPVSNHHEMRNNPGMGISSSGPLSRKISNSSNSLSSDMPIDVNPLKSGDSTNFSAVQNLRPSCASSQEFDKNSIIRSLQNGGFGLEDPQQATNTSTTITTGGHYNYFGSNRSNEKIVPPVVKVEVGCDKPVPAKRTHNFTNEKCPKVPMTNNGFAGNWLHKSDSQRLLEEELAVIAENLNSATLPQNIQSKTIAVTTQDTEANFKCEWSSCGLVFSEQDDLVRHIEKVHIDQRKADDSFVCFWENCVRKQKPFNARYKLVIHMRVHSGERPNRCTVSTENFLNLVFFFHFNSYLLFSCSYR